MSSITSDLSPTQAPSAELAATRQRRRRRPSSQARQRRTLFPSAEQAAPAAAATASPTGAAPEDPHRHSRRPVRELAMLRLRLRRRAVQAAPTDLARDPTASAATPAPAARPQPAVLATRCRPRTPRAARAEMVWRRSPVPEATPRRRPMRRRQAAGRRLPRRSRRRVFQATLAFLSRPAPPMQRRTPRP